MSKKDTQKQDDLLKVIQQTLGIAAGGQEPLKSANLLPPSKPGQSLAQKLASSGNAGPSFNAKKAFDEPKVKIPTAPPRAKR